MKRKSMVGVGLLAILTGLVAVKVTKRVRIAHESDEARAKRLGETYHREADFVAAHRSS